MSSPPEHDREKFGRVLGEALFARDMTQADLARLLGTTQSAVSSWIHGKAEPAAQVVFDMECVLEVPQGFFSRLLGYLPVTAVASVSSIEEAVQMSTLVEEDLKPMLLAVVRELKKMTRDRRAAAPAPRRKRST